MKKRAIGEISHDGGFPRLIKDVQESQEPLVIMKNNKEAAIVLPYSPEMVSLLENSVNLSEAMRKFLSAEMPHQLEMYLVGQYLSGLQARAVLFTHHSDDGEMELALWEYVVVDSFRQSVRDIMKNSAEDTALSRHDNRSAVVSEVKEEGLDSSPSLSRKRSKKRPSSP